MPGGNEVCAGSSESRDSPALDARSVASADPLGSRFLCPTDRDPWRGPGGGPRGPCCPCGALWCSPFRSGGAPFSGALPASFPGTSFAEEPAVNSVPADWFSRGTGAALGPRSLSRRSFGCCDFGPRARGFPSSAGSPLAAGRSF